MKISRAAFAALSIFTLRPVGYSAETSAPTSPLPNSKEESQTVSAAGESRDLREARAELEGLLQRYGKEASPVKQQLLRIAALKAREPFKIEVINFPGGSIQSFLNTISRNGGFSLNIVSANDPGDLATELPAFILNNARPLVVLDVLRSLLRAKGFALEIAGIPEEQNAAVAVLRRLNPAPELKRLGVSRFESYQIGSALKEQTIDNITDAIRTALAFKAPGLEPALQLKFHPPTTLLLASGPDEAVKIARAVVSQLRGISPQNFLPDANEGQRSDIFSYGVPRVNSVEEKLRSESSANEIQRRRAERQSLSSGSSAPDKK